MTFCGKSGSMFAGNPKPRPTIGVKRRFLSRRVRRSRSVERTATSTRKVEITPEVAEARQFEERLRHAYSDGGFLVLTVRPSRMRRCEDELLRRFRLERVSFDDLLFDALREEAKALEIDWAIIEQADGADHVEPGLEQPDAPRRAGGTEDRGRPVPAARNTCSWCIRG